MFDQTYVIGVDIGTSSTKSILFNDRREAISSARVDYRLYSPVAGAAEQDPEEIFAAVVSAIAQTVQTSKIQPAKIGCLAFSAAMHGLIAVDPTGTPLTQCITWADNRSTHWAEQIKRSPQGTAIYHRTGTPIHPMSPFVKIIWLREEYPEIFAQTSKFISIKEYIFYQLFNQFVIDYSIASATGLLNLESLSWDAEALALAGIAEQHLSDLVPTTQIFQSMQPDSAQTMGILPETPVVIGAGDGVLSNLGLGAIAPGTVAITVGTSGAIRAVHDRPTTDPQERLFCYALTRDRWFIGGATNNGGVILNWLREQLAIEDTHETLMALAQRVPAGAGGLIFHPYLLGERSPLWQPNARGSFFGLTINHSKAHLVRAVIEGIALNLKMIFQVVQEMTGPIHTVKVAGGLTTSSLWRQLLADVLNQEILVPKERESSSLGAAILGFYALKLIDSLDADFEDRKEAYRHQPIQTNAHVYQKMMAIYERLLPNLQSEYEAIARLQHELAGNTCTVLGD